MGKATCPGALRQGIQGRSPGASIKVLATSSSSRRYTEASTHRMAGSSLLAAIFAQGPKQGQLVTNNLRPAEVDPGAEFPLVLSAREGGDLVGHVVINSLLRGRAHGGLRMAPTVSVPELSALARTMTLKYGYLRLPFGGAKAGVIGDPEGPVDERQAALDRFARALAPELRSRVYVPAADMGTDAPAVRNALVCAGVPVARRQLRASHSGHYTAITVLHAARCAAESLGWGLEGKTAMVEGFGKVGATLATLLVAAGVRLVGLSTSMEACIGRRDWTCGLSPGPRRPSAHALCSRPLLGTPTASPRLIGLKADILFPCASYETIHASNWQTVQARMVCPGANNGLSPEAEAALVEHGTMVVPDFVANCGGVLGSVLEFASLGRDEIEMLLARQVSLHVPRLVAEAERQGLTLRQVAERLARQRFEGMAKADDSRSGRVILVRRRDGLLPAWTTMIIFHSQTRNKAYLS